MKKLEWVEVGRGLAAIAVLLSHCYELDDEPRFFLFFSNWGQLGVAFFFILSGFIIFHVHRDDIGRPKAAPHFAYRRFIRIFPTYWLVLFFALLLRQTIGNSDYRLHIDARFLSDQFLLLAPSPYIEVAWSLRYELVFYCMFFIAILNVRIGLLLLCAWFVYIMLSADWHNPCSLLTAGSERCAIIISHPGLFRSHLNLYFLVGAGIALALRNGMINIAALSATAAAAAFFILNCAYDSVYLLAATQFFGSASLVAWAVLISVKAPAAPRLFVWLGAISYPLYLVHLTAFQIAHGILRKAGSLPVPAWPLQFLLVIILTMISSCIIVRNFETPLFRRLGRSFRSAQTKGLTR